MSFRMRWTRPAGNQSIPFIPWSRPYQLEMPVFRESLASLGEYEPSHTLAIYMTLALFDTTSEHPFTEQEHPFRFEGFCKHAFWLLHQLRTFTDLEERRVPVYLIVTERSLDRFEPYRAACDFPQSRVIVLPNLEYNLEWGHAYPQWHIKLEGFFTKTLMQFERVLSVDASLVVQPPQADACRTPMFERILQLWDAPERQHIALHQILFKAGESALTFQLSDHVPHVTLEEMLTRFAELIGSDVATETAFWQGGLIYDMQGSIYGMSRAFREEKQELIRSLMRILPTDQMIICGALREMDATVEDVVEDICAFGALTRKRLREAQESRFYYAPSFGDVDSWQKESDNLLKLWRDIYQYEVDNAP